MYEQWNIMFRSIYDCGVLTYQAGNVQVLWARFPFKTWSFFFQTWRMFKHSFTERGTEHQQRQKCSSRPHDDCLALASTRALFYTQSECQKTAPSPSSLWVTRPVLLRTNNESCRTNMFWHFQADSLELTFWLTGLSSSSWRLFAAHLWSATLEWLCRHTAG